MTESDSHALLRIGQLSHQFQMDRENTPVLQDIQLHIQKGEFITLLGPSGCGKSTLFQIIGGLIRPVTGEVMIQGEASTGKSGHISYMPQQPALLPWRSVLDNVLLAAEISGTAGSEARSRASEWLKQAGLAEYEQHYPHQLSGGMQQRVAFVRALMSPQELMLLDEPFSALDAMTRQEMQQWLIRIWEVHRRTILFITHSIDEALFLSDRIYVMSARPGRIIEELKVPFSRPRTDELVLDPDFAAHKHRLYQRLKGEPTA
ncbi:ABC transporter ATP-binding protein [Marinicrinis sediminis]|uniref:ABC transporter ATP-binding protein n=1 Tax=Marinicrinis sediminis TaxID=1652465 RepID=A0ABW5R7R1_9BACL